MADQVATRLYFPPGAAPFGEMNLIRADYNRYSSTLESNLKYAAGEIVLRAWTDSDWLPEVIGEEAVTALSSAIYPPLQSRPTKAAINSRRFPGREVSWFALKPPSEEEREGFAYLNGLSYWSNQMKEEALYPNQVIGFAHAKNSVSGSATARLIKRNFHPEKVYAEVSDNDVLPAYQGKKIGAALLTASLGDFRPDQIPTMYVVAANKRLVAHLAQLTFVPTGEPTPYRTRDDLVLGSDIEEVRLQGKSVEEVRARLVERYHWLAEGVAL